MQQVLTLNRVWVCRKSCSAYKMLQQIINNRGVLDIETEDATLLKEICADFFVSGAYGQIYDLIEGGNKE